MLVLIGPGALDAAKIKKTIILLMKIVEAMYMDFVPLFLFFINHV